MDIAALSVIMNHGEVHQQANISLLKMAMDSSEINTDAMMKALEQSVHTHLGHNIDISV